MSIVRLPEAGGVPDVSGDVIPQTPGAFTVRDTATYAWLYRRAAGVYQAHLVTGDLSQLEAQASAVYTLAEWATDAGRRAEWDGLDVDGITLAGFAHSEELGAASEDANPLLVVDGRGRIITDDSGEPVEIT